MAKTLPLLGDDVERGARRVVKDDAKTKHPERGGWVDGRARDGERNGRVRA